MRLTSWPSYWNQTDGIVPAETQEVDIRATPDELRELARFLAKAADELEQPQVTREGYRCSADFGDDKPLPDVPIVFTVIGEVDEAVQQLLDQAGL